MNPEEIAAVLNSVAAGTLQATEISAPHDFNRVWRTSDGWSFTLFDDVGEMDYLDSAEAPDGRKGGYPSWPVNPLTMVPDQEALAKALKWCEGGDYFARYEYAKPTKDHA